METVDFIPILMELFVSNEDFCGTHGEPDWDEERGKWGIQRTAKTLKDRISPEHWRLHLIGERPLGAAPTLRDGSCWWGSIDIDDYNGDLAAVVSRLYKVEMSKMVLVPCRSKSGGLHLFLFLSEAAPARSVISSLADAAAALGVAGAEIFPKQSELRTERGDQPNWIVMPYFGALGPPGAGTYGGKLREQWGLKRGGAEMVLGEFVRAAMNARTPLYDFKVPRSTRRKPSATGAPEPFWDGPPCLQHLAAAGVPRGGQNNALLMMGIYYKRAHPDDWRHRLREANSTFLDPPGSEDAYRSAMQSLEKKDYNYTCKKEPMVSHCRVAICRGREFGVGEEGQRPLIHSISRYDTDPPLWFVDVEGHRVVATTEQLQNYPLFHRLCMEKASKTYGAMKQADWLQVLREAMESLTVIEAPPDVGESGRFLELLTEFLTNRMRGFRRDDLAGGRPWEDTEGGRHYFVLSPLLTFMRREGERDVRRAVVTQRIEGIGGGSCAVEIGGKQFNVWWVPAEMIVAGPALAVPRVERGPI
jgi:hypothetical protein